MVARQGPFLDPLSESNQTPAMRRSKRGAFPARIGGKHRGAERRESFCWPESSPRSMAPPAKASRGSSAPARWIPRSNPGQAQRRHRHQPRATGRWQNRAWADSSRRSMAPRSTVLPGLIGPVSATIRIMEPTRWRRAGHRPNPPSNSSTERGAGRGVSRLPNSRIPSQPTQPCCAGRSCPRDTTPVIALGEPLDILSHGAVAATLVPKAKLTEPDFVARARRIWGENPPGAPLSEIVSASRG